jgi:fructuronate reductase
LSERLSARSKAAAEAAARRNGASAGVVHFGPGAFHRAHQAWYFDRLMERDPRWAITGVSLRSTDVRDALAPQDSLYVLAELEQETSFRIIGALREVLVGAGGREAVMARMAAPETAWISATVTEKGYCLDGRGELDTKHPDIVADLASPRAPVSFVGYLVEGLRRRRAAGLAAPAVVSCDNIADNGRLLGAATVQFAEAQDKDLANWIRGEVAFPRTMVDSITPATDDALRQLVSERLGVEDAWPIQRERFTQWVIEDCLPANGPDLASVGVEITADVGAYERAKLRLLNGAHTTLAYLGLLRGHETVAEAMADGELAAFVEALMRNDIAPTVRAPQSLDTAAYIAAVLARFRNPAIRHKLSQIAWDGSKKLPFRLLDTIADAHSAGRPIERLCLAVSAWLAFLRRQALAGVAIVDPLEAKLIEIAKSGEGNAAKEVARFLALGEVFPARLRGDAQFAELVEGGYARLVADPRALP